jgi:hypothetical protein
MRFLRDAADEISITDDESANRLRQLLSSAIASMLRTCIDHSDAARIHWQMVTAKHRERWAQGDLDGIIPVLSDLLPWIREAGIDLSANTDVTALCKDPSFERVRNWFRTSGCDPKVFDLFRQLAGADKTSKPL